jgi:uncharacterized protein YfdQ (DUF2303 family)
MQNPIESAFQIGQAIKPVEIRGMAPVVLVPAGMEAKVLTEFENPAPLPDFITADPQLHDVASFVAYVNRFKGVASLIAITDRHMVARLDYHSPSAPRRDRHVASYCLEPSEQYAAWTGINNKSLAQEEFALFLEERARDVVMPSSAEMMEIVLTLQSNTSIEFKSGKRLDNATQQLQYVETQTTKAGQQGNMDVPTGIRIEIPLFRHGEIVGIEAKLRCLVRDGKAFFVVKLLGLEDARDQAVEAMIAKVAQETELPVMRGIL